MAMKSRDMADLSPTSTHYPVSLWEGIAIIAGALLLVVVGLAGLGVKALNNAFDPQRAEAIAQSMMNYTIPGGSKGLFGANLGGAKVAVVASQTPLAGLPQQPLPPPVELFVARIPINTSPTDPETNSDNEFLFSGFSFSYQDSGIFQVSHSRSEQQPFCGASVPVTIQEGTLTIGDPATSIAAVRYEANLMLDTNNHIAIVSAVGPNAEENVAQVFRSLECKEELSGR